MAQAKIDIDYLAKLANIILTPKEKKQLEKDIPHILRFIKTIKYIDTKGIEPSFQATPLRNVSQKDRARPSLPRRAALANAAKKNDKYFISRPVF